MGLPLYKRYGYIIVVVLLAIVLIVFRLLLTGHKSIDPFITVMQSIDAEDDSKWSYVENELVNLTDFRYTLKSQVCNASVVERIGKHRI